MTSYLEASLERLLDARSTGTPLLLSPRSRNPLERADLALSLERYEDAVTEYEKVKRPTRVTHAKHGYCLALLGRGREAEKLLTVENVGSNPIAKATLAYALSGPNGTRLRGFGSTEAISGRVKRQETVERLLKEALAVEEPPRLVFSIWLGIRGTHAEEAEGLANWACSLYPDWDEPHAILASKMRLQNGSAHQQLDALMPFVASTLNTNVLHEAYVHALELGRLEEAEKVVQAIATIVASDLQAGDGNSSVVDEMRSMVDLYRARAGDGDAYGRIRARMAPWAESGLEWQASSQNPVTAIKFLIQTALEIRDNHGLAAAIRTLLDRAWALPVLSGESLDSWNPLISTPSLDQVLHFGNFSFDYARFGDDIASTLDSGSAEHWQILLAIDAVSHGSPNTIQVELVRQVAMAPLPAWMRRGAFSAFAHHEPKDLRGAGALLCAWSESVNQLSPELSEQLRAELSCLYVDALSSDDVALVFEGSFNWLLDNEHASGHELLHIWSDLMDSNGAHDVLERIARLSLSRGDSQIARDSLILAQEGYEEEEEEDDDESLTEAGRIRRYLAKQADPATNQTKPKDLTLLEATTLVALLRACTLDHITWRLTPLASAGRAFEPTKKFIGTLFSLADRGVIAADQATPAGVFIVRDGTLRAYLDRVIWRISPHTLELQRAIRDLPHSQWPAEWRIHAPVFARDLGVEELIAYITLLLNRRDLPAPEAEELRGIFRIQLERLSIAQCYYLAHKSVRETVDYQAQYRPGEKQLRGRALNLLRGNGEKAVANNWNTRFERTRDFPASLLFEALHDVLTGWGQRAFDDPICCLDISYTQ